MMVAMELRAPTPADVGDIVSLLIACDIADYGTPDYDQEALLTEWAQVDLARDAFLGEWAYGLLLRNHVRGWVHPDHRGEGRGAALAERLEARAREKGLAWVEAQVPRADPRARALLEERGYELVRSYRQMRLEDVDVERLPLGETRAYDPADEAAVQELFDRAVGDGVGRVEPLDVLLARNPDPSLWLVAERDGAVAGAVRAELRAAGFITGYITQLAVDPAHRRGGIASALVGAIARELVERGAAGVSLHVRSNATAAQRLFEHLGFAGDWQVDELRLQL
jgi:ribosomal protein S18 acetylase RimI-like enzyme